MSRAVGRVGAALGMAALAGLVVMAGCSVTRGAGGSGGPAPATGRLLISTGTTGGVYNAWGASLASQLRVTDPGLRVRVETSSGSVANLARLEQGTADLGLTTMDATEEHADPCRRRASGERRVVPLRALAHIYDDYLQIVVRAGSAVRSVADLAGRPVAVGSPGSGTALVACRVLSSAGVRVDERPLNVGPGLAALEAGDVEAVIWSGGLPTVAIENAARTSSLRLLSLGPLVDTLRTRYSPAYRPATVPAGRYGSRAQVTTLASPNLLVARADADPAMVGSVLDTVFRRRDEIAATVPAADSTDRRTAIFTGSLPLHPAAVEYYRRAR